MGEVIDKEILRQAKQIAVREATAEIIDESRREITKRARRKISHIYAKLLANRNAGKTAGPQ